MPLNCDKCQFVNGLTNKALGPNDARPRTKPQL